MMPDWLNWLAVASHVVVTAGASAPESLVLELVERLKGLGATDVVGLKVAEERVQFSLPTELTA